MLARLKSVIQQSFIYSLSNVALKAVGVILLPIYVHKLSVTSFGVWDLLDTTIQILTEILLLGQASAIILLNNSAEYNTRKRTSFFTLTSFVFLFCIILIVITEVSLAVFSDWLNNSLIKPEYIRFSAFIILLRVTNNLFFAKIRADEEAGYFTVVSLIRVLMITLLTIYFVLIKKLGIDGALYSFLITEFMVIVILLFRVIPRMQAKFDKEILSVALKFGLPLLFSSVGFMLLNLSDRYIIKYLLGAKYVAYYGLGYRVAGVLNMFLILPFNLGLLPIAYKYYGQHDDKRFFTKLMTYSTFMFVWGFVFLSLFSPEIIRVFAGKENYGNVYIVVPVILLSYVFSGMRLTASLGMMLTKNTKHIAWITIGAAVLNIVLNFLFIPMYGIVAAAVNTLIAFIVFYVVTHILSGRYLEIPFENLKLILMLVTGTVLSAIIYFFPSMNIWLTFIIKLGITIIFPLLLFIFGFYEKAELEVILNPAKLVEFVKGLFKSTKESAIAQNINS